jgi:hypothetical protein
MPEKSLISMQQKETSNLKQDFTAIKILFAALFTGPIIFIALSFALVQISGKGLLEDDSMDKIFLIASSIIAGIALPLAFSNYRKALDSASQPQQETKGNFNNYRAALIIFMALCEGAALFAVIGFLLTANYWFVLIVAVMLVAMLFKRPSKQRVIDELQLNSEERLELKS